MAINPNSQPNSPITSNEVVNQASSNNSQSSFNTVIINNTSPQHTPVSSPTNGHSNPDQANGSTNTNPWTTLNSIPSNNHHEPVQANDSVIGLVNGSANESTNPETHLATNLTNLDAYLTNPLSLIPEPIGFMPLATSSSERPRSKGRPKGSKNKPKAVTINHDHRSFHRTHTIEIPDGADIVESIRHFARRQHVGVSIHSGLGQVRNVTVQNSGTNKSNISHAGTHGLVFINGLHHGSAIQRPPLNSVAGIPVSYPCPSAAESYLNVILCGPSGGFWGGLVVGPLIASGRVILHVSPFECYDFQRVVPEALAQAHYPGSDGAGPSSSCGNDGLNSDPNYSGRKRRRFSNY
ncbi:hypothetical protein RND81_12G177200 [Saponaria officinalis]|uniref:PPC domain-containing protein n=1 Tax=Saponaria officinalis TaxID=3572 RepID=A0AAW1HC72_SAPOF